MHIHILYYLYPDINSPQVLKSGEKQRRKETKTRKRINKSGKQNRVLTVYDRKNNSANKKKNKYSIV